MLSTHGLRSQGIAIIFLFVLFVGLAINVQAQGDRIETFPSSKARVSQNVRAASMESHEDDSTEGRDTAFHILTYNTQFRDAEADLFAPGWPNTGRRARAIGQAI